MSSDTCKAIGPDNNFLSQADDNMKWDLTCRMHGDG